MKHIKEYKDIDWEDWDEEEFEDRSEIECDKEYEYYKQFIGTEVRIKDGSIHHNQNKPSSYIGILAFNDVRSLDNNIIIGGHYIFRINWYVRKYFKDDRGINIDMTSSNVYRCMDIEIVK